MIYAAIKDINYCYLSIGKENRIYYILKNLKVFKSYEFINNDKIAIELIAYKEIKCDNHIIYNTKNFFMLVEDFNKYFISERKAKLDSLL